MNVFPFNAGTHDPHVSSRPEAIRRWQVSGVSVQLPAVTCRRVITLASGMAPCDTGDHLANHRASVCRQSVRKSVEVRMSVVPSKSDSSFGMITNFLRRGRCRCGEGWHSLGAEWQGRVSKHKHVQQFSLGISGFQ